MAFAKLTASALLLFYLATFCAAAPNEHRSAEHVVVIVWDGMRPDFVNKKDCPTLAALAHDGVFFRNNHSSYPTSTNVNGAVLATGDYPGHNGLIANQEYRPQIDALKRFDTSDFPALDAAGQQANAKYLAAPTVAETVQKAGYRTAVAGSKPVAQLADRARKRKSEAATKSVVIYRGKVLPTSAGAAITAVVGPYPERKDAMPNTAVDAWTTRALTDVLWKNDVPKFSLLWLSEPDLTQHRKGPGSPPALAAIKSDDDNLARVLAALRAKNALTSTDIFVVSDHGFSTIDRAADLATELRKTGFDAVRFFTSPPKPGQVMVVSLGGSVEFYVIGHVTGVIHKLVDYLQAYSNFPGVILTREKMKGTFTLAQVHLANPHAPDIIITSRWCDRPNDYGTEGEIASDLGKVGRGTHSTFSPHDLHNTLIASGPDFRHGWQDETPTGNIDVAPTVLWLLGLKPLQSMDGRVLREALVPSSVESPPAKESTLTARREFKDGSWKQTLRLTKVAGVTYFLEGNGGRNPGNH